MNAIDTEYNNCYDAARMELSRENHATVEKIDALVRAGLWVVKASAPHYCPFTDAYVGERVCIVDVVNSPSQARQVCRRNECFGPVEFELSIIPNKKPYRRV